jgi:hypothetical protein
MGQLPYQLKGNFKRLLKDFKHGRIPPDTVGKFVAPIARLVHLWGGDPEEVIRACIERWREHGVDTSFSDRVSWDEDELWRVFGYLRDAIKQGNGYQAQPDVSTDILQKVVACWRQRGFDPVAYLLADDAELPVTSKIDVTDVPFEFKYAERLLLKERLHPVLQGRGELDVRHTYACARRVIAFVKKYPHREFACLQLLPLLCGDLPIQWHKNRCYAVMRCLMGLGFIRVRYEYQGGRSWLWRGHLPQFNKARTFELGEALRPYLGGEGTAVPPLSPVSIISHLDSHGAGWDQAAWEELLMERDRLEGRRPLRARREALV